jgi:hypothetical protein
MTTSESPEQRGDVENALLREQREHFGLTSPTLPTPAMVEDYEGRFSGWESDFLVATREEGFSADLVRDLRDTAVRLGMQVDRKSPGDDALDRALASTATG